MQLVFDAPVLANHAVQSRRIGLEAGDVIAGFALGLARRLVVALALDAHQPLQRLPLRSLVYHAQVGNHRAAALLDAPVAAVDFFADRV